MTLRELINHVLDRGKFHKTIGYIHSTDPKWQKQDIARVHSSYTNAVQELMDLPGSDELADHKIVVESNVQDQEEFVDVYIESDTGRWGTCFIDWNDLIDLPIADKISTELSDVLAHVLYDITFWGFTRKNVIEAGESIMNIDETEVIEVDLDTLLGPED